MSIIPFRVYEALFIAICICPFLSPNSNSDTLNEWDTRYKFATQIVLLLLGAWLTLLAFNSTMVLLPISIGRAIFSSFSRLPITRGAKCNGE